MAKILVADDSRTSRRMLLDIIRTLDFEEIIEATDGNDAVAKFLEHQPDVVTLDITMPGMDGIEATEKIKAVAEGPCANTPIVLFTANVIESLKEMYSEIGFAEFLSKPVLPEKLLEVIKKILPQEKIKHIDTE